MPLRVSCPGPLLRLACLGGGGSGPGSPLPGCCCEGRLRSGAPPPPTARPLGGLLGSATHVLWAPVCGCGGRKLYPLGLHALWGLRAAGVVWWGGRTQGGVACHCCEGRLVSGAVPPPTTRPLRGCQGPLPTCCGCGGVRAWGPITNPTERALASWLCALWGRHEGARGGRLLPGCGASGVGRSPTPECPPFGRAAGAHYPLAVGAGGCGRGDPSPTPQRALLRVVGAA